MPREILILNLREITTKTSDGKDEITIIITTIVINTNNEVYENFRFYRADAIDVNDYYSNKYYIIILTELKSSRLK